ncbi:MAG: amidohydrolase [Faecousia sp.]
MQIIQDRRALHQIPELDMALPKTVAYLKNALAPLNCRVFSPIPEAVCAWFDFGAQTALAFRADMDALPIAEVNETDYASRHPGNMHACGHDGHMAILLELGRRLSRRRENKHNILLVFQPAEETTGGAKNICDSGVFRDYRVEAIFGLHLWPGLPKGVISSRCQELMARSSEVNVEIFGKSAHIARSWEGCDALAAGTEFYRRAVAMERSLPDSVFRLLKFGHFESGTVRNALSAYTRMEGSLRAFQDEIFEQLRQGMYDIGRDIEAETGCTVQLQFSTGYPAVLNPPALYQRARNCVDFPELDAPSMTAEDFAFYQRTLPGLFFFLGTGDSPALHTSCFDFDESILEKGADFFEKLAVNL